METLTRQQLTVALAARQLLLERVAIDPAQAIRRLTPLQGQEPQAPYVALAARLEGFTREALETAIDAREVVKTTINRMTLHLVAAEDYPAYAQLARQARLRTWRRKFAHLDEAAVVGELTDWLSQPRTDKEIRARLAGVEPVICDPSAPIAFIRTLLPLVQLPPAGHWGERSRPRFIVHPEPLPSLEDAAALVVERYLEAYGPASRRDIASWAGTAQRDLAPALERLETVSYRDEQGAELLDLPGRPLPPAGTPLPVRFFGRWEQPLLAYADRDRILPEELLPLKLTLSGDQTVTVDGRVAASWKVERRRRTARLVITPLVKILKAARAEVEAEGERTARFVAPEVESVEVAWA